MKFVDFGSLVTRTMLVSCVAFPVAVACSDSAPYVQSSENQAEVAANLETNGLSTADEASIAVYGRFREYLGGSLFVLEEGRFGDTNNFLVVNSSDRSFTVPINEGTPLWAVGAIDSVNPDEIDGLDPAMAEALEGESALFADRITLAPAPTDLTENAEAFYHQDVTIYGEVEQVNANNTFILEDPALFEGRGVIVIQTGDTTVEAIADNAKVAVSGVLRPYAIADIKTNYDLTWDLELTRKLETDYADVPVLIADLITLTNDY